MNKNYELIERRYVADVEGDVYLLRHIKSGASIVKIANSDSNKTFCIAFSTEPDDDSGIPHILEHSVLNGSKKYPVKSPFDQMYKGSLATFLNAMTASDMTMFPVASISTKDYFNLMDVYLDAVFNPRIYDDRRILKQEGWRIAAMDPKDDFKYTGVVYNEMKGAYSDPMQELETIINRNLFPDNGYGRVSGGYPSAIPSLTQEHFTEYHRKHYHPENSFVFFYGDADMEDELRKLDEEYLSKYSRINGNYDIKEQAPFSEPKSVKGFYPADSEADAGSDSFLAISYVTCKNTDYKHLLALDILSDVLVTQESGELKNAFLQSGIGCEIESYCNPTRQSVFHIWGFNCDSSRAEEFRELVLAGLKKAAENGLDKETVQAVVNRREFLLREGNDAQQGLRRLYEILSPWMAGQNPIDILESTKLFEQLKQDIENGLLEETIREFLIDNPHQLLVALEPKAGLEQEIEARTQLELNKIKESMTPEQIDALIEENKELDLMQNTPESPEALSCIPVLAKNDIPPKAENFEAEERNIDGIKTIYYESPTHGITYLKFIFNMRTLPEELIPYGSLITEILGMLSTSKRSFGDLDNLMKTYTGGCWTNNEILSYLKDNKRVVKVSMVMGGKCLSQNIDKTTDIMAEIISESDLSDKSRLKDLISRLDAEQDNELSSKAYQYMRNRVESYFTEAGAIDEYISGIDFYLFVKDLCKNFDSKADEIIANLKKTLSLLARRDNVMCFVQCEAHEYEAYERGARKFLSQLIQEKSTLQQWNIKPEAKNEGFIGQSKVQYVLKGFDSLNDQYRWNGNAMVLSKILSSDYLQNNVRVRGGAYGAWSTFCNEGFFCMASYRDPNLSKTLDIYDKASEYVANYNDDDETLLKYIIGTISGKDKPLTTAQKGSVALNRYMTGRTPEMVQQERDEILNVSADDIRKYAGVLKQMSENGAFCVFGGEDIINQNSQIFKNIIRL